MQAGRKYPAPRAGTSAGAADFSICSDTRQPLVQGPPPSPAAVDAIIQRVWNHFASPGWWFQLSISGKISSTVRATAYFR